MKPLLAHTINDTSAIKYPVFCSVKLDGIRCLIIDGVAVSRTLKPIRNEYVQACIGKPEFNGLDGELIVGDIFDKACYRNTNSGVMSKDGEPDFEFHVFDYWDEPQMTFCGRHSALAGLTLKSPQIQVVPHLRCDNEADLLRIEQNVLNAGGEGVMVRSVDGKYKQGRSTLKEGILGKLKRFVDSEFLVVGFQERFHNANEATTNALGHTERSSHKENKVGRGDLGALVLQMNDGQEFTCGTGFDDNLRRLIWNNRPNYLGRYAKIKHFEIGVKTLPRFPVFLDFRDRIDL